MSKNKAVELMERLIKYLLSAENVSLLMKDKRELLIRLCIRFIFKYIAKVDINKNTLESYFRRNFDLGIIDHSIGCDVKEGEGKIKFYIHPTLESGETLNFEVNDNILRTLYL